MQLRLLLGASAFVASALAVAPQAASALPPAVTEIAIFDGAQWTLMPRKEYDSNVQRKLARRDAPQPFKLSDLHKRATSSSSSTTSAPTVSPSSSVMTNASSSSVTTSSSTTSPDPVPTTTLTLPSPPMPTGVLANVTVPANLSTLNDFVNAFKIVAWGFGQALTTLVQSVPTTVYSAVGLNYAGSNNHSAIRAFYPAGSFSPGNQPIGGFGMYAQPLNLASAKNVSFSYSVLFPKDFNFVMGGKLPGLMGTGTKSHSCSGGYVAEDCWSTRMMWRGKGNGELYFYGPRGKQQAGFCAMTPNNICNTTDGMSIGRGSWQLTPGAWTNIRQDIWLNTPGIANGGFNIWINGRLATHSDQVYYQNPDNRSTWNQTPIPISTYTVPASTVTITYPPSTLASSTATSTITPAPNSNALLAGLSGKIVRIAHAVQSSAAAAESVAPAALSLVPVTLDQWGQAHPVGIDVYDRRRRSLDEESQFHHKRAAHHHHRVARKASHAKKSKSSKKSTKKSSKTTKKASKPKTTTAKGRTTTKTRTSTIYAIATQTTYVDVTATSTALVTQTSTTKPTTTTVMRTAFSTTTLVKRAVATSSPTSSPAKVTKYKTITVTSTSTTMLTVTRPHVQTLTNIIKAVVTPRATVLATTTVVRTSTTSSSSSISVRSSFSSSSSRSSSSSSSSSTAKSSSSTTSSRSSSSSSTTKSSSSTSTSTSSLSSSQSSKSSISSSSSSSKSSSSSSTTSASSSSSSTSSSPSITPTPTPSASYSTSTIPASTVTLYSAPPARTALAPFKGAMLDTFYGGSSISWAPTVDEEAWFDNWSMWINA
ncbi:polysaccharide lyase family 14 protein [Mixia osmundae IAM 14324]|uniref:Polysaccharide lyase 14 domain-containing protein n=1 Tax=Mixia osmundae (strain CBS 9802 / IAM 14324 / JCM 22182 / KY 12970) TaxID=764103 RepID=G7DTE9_MIXOS|nr:polysaccharide lyase family 14 protein [Mixia osmundae IAM 14324]KEI42865.1 polysaccharide lyase family 14 protein [Mixia osmundae IAM 14324]GAA93796.1 hypothetical protein E5Q_00442 [Mixia osmundae IAM 14324]